MKIMQDSLVSIILPCYNEKENIIPLVDEIHNVLNSTWKHQIVVVDDNSPDGTYNRVVNQNYDYIKAILRTEKPSLGGSVRTGIENSEGDIIVVMDSDFNHRPEDLPILLDNLHYYDCVVASRFLYGGKAHNRFRHLASWLYNIFIRIVTRKYITDSLFGYFAIKRATLEKLNYDNIFWGYGDYCIRLMFYLQKGKVNILQVPGVLGKRRNGKGNRKFIRTFKKYTTETLKLINK